MKTLFLLIAILSIAGCDSSHDGEAIKSNTVEVSALPRLDLTEANRLAQLPLHCIEIEYPNKLNQVIGGAEDLQSPKELHPAFYGCFDWHSAVHGHWSLVSLLRQFPDLDKAALIKKKLLVRISKKNILAEVAYFEGVHSKPFERTYGWAWILKLAEELHAWDDPIAKELVDNLTPLTDLLINRYIEFLPKLNYPIRVGEHSNTAFGLSFAWDYANATEHRELKEEIEQRANFFYSNDEGCPIEWEPSGYDFLSPCLEEAALMKRILTKPEFSKWINDFLPQLGDESFDLEVGKVTDRSDGKLVHLDGVNFSRAWSLNKIAQNLTEYQHLKNVANKHINYSLPNIVNDEYEGGHWLGSFAIYALNSAGND